MRALYNRGGIEAVLADESLAWLYLLADGYKDPEEVDRMAGAFPTMEEFAQRYGLAIGDPDLALAYERYWESEMEYNSAINYAKREGREEGILEERMRIDAALRAAGMDEAADLLAGMAG